MRGVMDAIGLPQIVAAIIYVVAVTFSNKCDEYPG